jgi:hypothetical protein
MCLRFFITLACFNIIMISTVWALDIDEKLTARILRLSTSQRTVLLNRGLEDGLVIGDHAKFFLVSGVIARAVVVKASPSRSVWSVYRLINPNELTMDKAIELKIASPVKLSDDPSRAFGRDGQQYDLATGRAAPDAREVVGLMGADDIPLAPWRDRDGRTYLSEDNKELEALGVSPASRSAFPPPSEDRFIQRDWETWGLVYFNTMNSSSNEAGNGQDTSGSNSTVNYSLGLEKYFPGRGNWYYDFSLLAFVHNSVNNKVGVEGEQLKHSCTEFGLGTNYHLFGDPFAFHRLIGYFNFSMAMGKSSDSFIVDNAPLQPYNGISNSWSLGVGGKYYLPSGFGARLLFDYYNRQEKYSFDQDTSNNVADVNRTYSGLRFQFGLSYRF